MPCLRCHNDVASDAKYCPTCGAPQYRENQNGWANRRLVRIAAEQKVAGVCAGIADYLDVDVTLVRILWLTFSIIPGVIVGGLVAYLVAWVVMPLGEASREVRGRRLVRSATDAKIAGVCGGLARYFEVDSTPIRVLWVVLSVLPGAVIFGVVAYLIAWLIVPKEPVAIARAQPA